MFSGSERIIRDTVNPKKGVIFIFRFRGKLDLKVNAVVIYFDLIFAFELHNQTILKLKKSYRGVCLSKITEIKLIIKDNGKNCLKNFLKMYNISLT